MSEDCSEEAATPVPVAMDAEKYFGDIVALFVGVGDAKKEGASTDEDKDEVMWEESLEPITSVFKDCVKDEKYESIGGVRPLENLILAAWNGKLEVVQEILPRLFVSPAYAPTAQYICLALVRISSKQNHTLVLDYVLSHTPATNEKVWRHSGKGGDVMNTFEFVMTAGVWNVYLSKLRQRTGDLVPLFEDLLELAMDKFSSDAEAARSLIDILVSRGLDITEQIVKDITYSDKTSLDLQRFLFERGDLEDVKLVNVLDFHTQPPDTAKLELLLDTIEDLDYKPKKLPQKEDIPIEQLINMYNCLGTALHHAAFYGNDDLVWLLLKREARRDVKDRQGRTALEVAEERGNKVCVSFLMMADECPLFLPD